jgi:hypothetical protein
MTVGCGEANNCWDKEIDCGGWVGKKGGGKSWCCDHVWEMGPVRHEAFGQQGNELARKILCRAIHADGLLEISMYSPMHQHTTFSVILGRRFVPTF